MPDNESSSVSSSRFARRMRRRTGGCVYQAERERESDYGVMAGRGGLKSRLRARITRRKKSIIAFVEIVTHSASCRADLSLLIGE